MTKDKDTKSDIKVPAPKKTAQPAYVQFQGGYQSQRGGGSGGGKRGGGGSGSPIRRSAPGGGK